MEKLITTTIFYLLLTIFVLWGVTKGVQLFADKVSEILIHAAHAGEVK